MEEWDKTYQKWKSIEDEKREKLKQKTEEIKRAEVYYSYIITHTTMYKQ